MMNQDQYMASYLLQLSPSSDLTVKYEEPQAQDRKQSEPKCHCGLFTTKYLLTD